MIAYRADIDGLRAVAILSVVAFHADQVLLPGGFIGVDIFFVISGYLITRIILADWDSGQFSFTNFWARRARRILPALLFMLLVVTAVAALMLLPDDLNQYGQLLSHTAVFTANLFLAQDRGYFDPINLDSPLLHVWSLAVEEQYYLIWPILLTVSVRTLKRPQLIGGLVVLFCLSLAYSEWAIFHAPKQAFYNLPSRAFELLIGAGIAIANPGQIKSRLLAETLSAFGVLLVCLGLIFIDEKSRFPGIAALLPCCGTALLLLGGGRSTRTLIERGLASPVLVPIGRISYSWYLWHWPPLAFARYYYERPLTQPEIAMALSAGLLLAVVSWHFVERPFRMPAAPSRFRRAFLPMAICSSVALLALGAAFHRLNGLPSRIDKDSLAMLDQFQRDKSLGCNDRLQGRVELQKCEFGKIDAAGPSVMLWGDSHAGHYLPALAKIAAAQGVKGELRRSSDCRPFVDPEGIETKSAHQRLCRAANEATFAELSSRPDIASVVLAARWAARDIAATDGRELAVFSRNLERTIVALERIGKQVMILGPAPELPLNLKSCMTKQIRFARKIPGCESVAMTSIGYQTGIWNLMRQLSGRHPELTYFAPQNYLCEGSVCRTTDGQGHPLYTDNHHLSARGAYLLQPYINDAIAPLLQGLRPQFVQTRLH